ncbi:PQQ-dependent sugar dehydrogenase [Sulfurovum sp. zt1-1]|uniref:PQQ-dependent sugar dehydrogenase n=1 Tax=Sulfurovum zhangzhouensis TaxID=3019067 RepID=A0ABT7QUP7_9BACT|nr:PQQ-dependent sugar dehydrogenase [Sulfurovum zhangzhouensis]MDM5270572.1 PQQ-dependent sugar dehydrogenase [Sulfurovum zhangzhouensis]
MKVYFFWVILFVSFLTADTEYKLEKLASGHGVIWGMVFIDDGKLLFTQREGKAGILSVDTRKTKMLKGLPKIRAKGQGGLLDVTLSPNFINDGWIYFTYVKEVGSEGATTLARAKLDHDRLEKWQDIIVTKSTSSQNIHFGSRIAFDKRGHLFLTIGDRGIRDNAQNLRNHAGTILRLNLDGSVPKDNPFVSNPTAQDEIYSYGHRNPQGIYYDNVTNRLWAIEHGPRGGDEINLIKKGHNYGWPVISYGTEYWNPLLPVGEGTHKKGMMQPQKVYIPSIAPSSLMIYNGNLFPRWKDKLFTGALVQKHINIIGIDNNGNLASEERIVENLGERIRCITQDKKGYIYFSTDSGDIFKLSPA